MSLTKVSNSMITGAPVSVFDFGVVADGVTDDADALQAAIKYCFDNDANLIASTGDCYVSKTVYIPNSANGDLVTSTTLDFAGMTFLVDAGNTLFESGQYSGGAWVSTFNNADGVGNSFNVVIENFSISGGSYGLRLNNMHQGCYVRNITSKNCETVVDLNHCYYTNVDNVASFSDDSVWVDERFIFRGSTNLMKLSHLVATNSAIGYKFEGPVSQVDFTNNSIEGCTNGIHWAGLVQEMSVKNCYIESIGNVVFQLGASVDVRSLDIDDNYYNLGNRSYSYIFEKLSDGDVGAITFGRNNYVNRIYSKQNYFKIGGVTYGDMIVDIGTSQVNFNGDLIVFADTDWPLNTVLKGTKAYGFNEGLAKINTGICEGNYSGRMTTGLNPVNKLFGCALAQYTATTAEYETKIIFQEHQLIYAHIVVNTGGIGYITITGLIVGSTFQEFGTSGYTLTPTVDGDGYVYITVGGLTTPSITRGAEVRII